MASATDFIVLSSSPERNAICTPPRLVEDTERLSSHVAFSSLLPSPSELFQPPTRSRFFDSPDHDTSKTKDSTAEDARRAKRAITSSNPDNLGDKQTRRGRKPITGPRAELRDLDQAVLENKENAAAKSKRTRKGQADSGAGSEKRKNKTITGKVTKSGTAKSKAPGAKTTGGSLTSKTTRERSAEKEVKDKDDYEKDLQLEPAMRRRLDWTPTRQTAQPVLELEGKDGAEGGQNGLGTILSGYEYDGIAAAASGKPQVSADTGPTKRRRIELVDSRVLPTKPKPFDDDSAQNSEGDGHLSAVSKPSKKPKARAKRLTTLTARVTALYCEESMNCSDSTDPGISTATDSSTAANSKSRKGKRKADENAGFKFPRTIVLPPEAAVKSLAQQDLIFGTCSQLEREDSPSLLRDTQAALQESEKESSCAPSSSLAQYPELARSSSAISRLATPRNLWSVAARDTEGLLVDLEIVNLVDSPEVSKTTSPPVNDDKEKDNQPRDAAGTNSFCNLSPVKELTMGSAPTNNELPVSTARTVEHPISNKPNASSKPMPNYDGWTDSALATRIQSYGLKAIKNRKTMIEVLEKCWIAQHGPATQKEGEESQPKETTTTIPAASEPQKAQTKPKKLRATSQRKPKAQLQSQPATSQSKKKDDETITAVNESKQTPTKPRHQQGSHSNHPVRTEYSSQPTLKRSFIDVEEIQDSEDELLPSPSKLFDEIFTNSTRKEESKKQELPTSPIPSSPRRPSRSTKETPAVSAHSKTSTIKLPDLGEQITKAVRAQPRQQQQEPPGTRKRPSWHEKILMYDPIYLEDFTAWLNTEGLGLVNEDRELGAGFVRQWCESKGVCCCYKVKKNAGHF